MDPAVAASPAALHAMPDAVIAPIVQAYADSINFVFFWTVPVAAVGFIVAWFLVERPLHDAARGRAADMGEGFGAPDPAPSEERLARMIADVMQRERKTVFTDVYRATDSLLDRADAWALRQVYVLQRAGEGASVRKIAAAHRVPPEVLTPVFTQAVRVGLLSVEKGRLRMTPIGRAEFERFIAAWRHWLDAHLDDWDLTDPEDREVFDKAVTRIAHEITAEEAETWSRPEEVATRT